MDVRVVDPHNREMKPDEIGSLVIKLPLPPGAFPTLWNADDASLLPTFHNCPDIT